MRKPNWVALCWHCSSASSPLGRTVGSSRSSGARAPTDPIVCDRTQVGISRTNSFRIPATISCRKDDGALMTFIELALLLIYLCILLAKSCDLSPEACSMYGLGDDSTGLYLFFLFTGLSMLVVHIVVDIIMLITIIKRDRRVESIRLRSNGEPPDLTLPKDCLYHVFLSHVWKTGQGAPLQQANQLSN